MRTLTQTALLSSLTTVSSYQELPNLSALELKFTTYQQKLAVWLSTQCRGLTHFIALELVDVVDRIVNVCQRNWRFVLAVFGIFLGVWTAGSVRLSLSGLWFVAPAFMITLYTVVAAGVLYAMVTILECAHSRNLVVNIFCLVLNYRFWKLVVSMPLKFNDEDLVVRIIIAYHVLAPLFVAYVGLGHLSLYTTFGSIALFFLGVGVIALGQHLGLSWYVTGIALGSMWCLFTRLTFGFEVSMCGSAATASRTPTAMLGSSRLYVKHHVVSVSTIISRSPSRLMSSTLNTGSRQPVQSRVHVHDHRPMDALFTNAEQLIDDEMYDGLAVLFGESGHIAVDAQNKVYGRKGQARATAVAKKLSTAITKPNTESGVRGVFAGSKKNEYSSMIGILSMGRLQYGTETYILLPGLNDHELTLSGGSITVDRGDAVGAPVPVAKLAASGVIDLTPDNLVRQGVKFPSTGNLRSPIKKAAGQNAVNELVFVCRDYHTEIQEVAVDLNRRYRKLTWFHDFNVMRQEAKMYIPRAISTQRALVNSVGGDRVVIDLSNKYGQAGALPVGDITVRSKNNAVFLDPVAKDA